MAFPTNPTPVQGDTHNEAGIDYTFDGVRWLLTYNGGLTEQQVRVQNALIIFARAYGYLQPPSGLTIGPQNTPIYLGIANAYMVDAVGGLMEDSVTYEFDWQDGTPIDTIHIEAPLPPDPNSRPDGRMTSPIAHTFGTTVQLPHSVKLRVTNVWGTSDWVDIPLDVAAVPAPSDLDVSLDNGAPKIYLGTETTLNWSAGLTAVDAADIEFDFQDGTAIVTQHATGDSFSGVYGQITHTFTGVAGAQAVIKVRASNAFATGDWTDFSFLLAAIPAPQNVTLAMTGGQTVIRPNVAVTFQWGANFLLETEADFEFDWGDGSAIETVHKTGAAGSHVGATISHTFTGPAAPRTVKIRATNVYATGNWIDFPFASAELPDATTYTITPTSTWNDGAAPTNAQLADGDLTTLLALKPQDVDTAQEVVIEFPVKTMPNYLTASRVATVNATGMSYWEGFRFDLITVWYDVEGDGTWVRSSDWDAKLPNFTPAVKTVSTRWTKGSVKKIKFAKRVETPAPGFAIGFGDLFFSDTDLSADNTPEPPQS